MTAARAARRAVLALELGSRAAAATIERGEPRRMAVLALVEGINGAVEALAPYAGGMPPLPPHTLIVLSNGSTLRTTQNSTAEIAGLINAGVAKIYQVPDLDGVIHHLMVSAILDFYAVNGA